jgi:hypothetical protein
VISNGQDYANDLVTLTMPLSVADDDAVMPFYYDQAGNQLEPITMVERTASTATLSTRHFTRDLMALPGNSAAVSALRSAMASGFGSVKVVWVKTSKQKLVGTFDSGFRPGVDNWEFENRGSYASPLGECEGMSITSMYYYYFQKLGGKPPLYHQYDLTLPNVLDNVQGIRFAGAVQLDYEDRFHAGLQQLKSLQQQAKAKGTKAEDLTSIWILMTLKLTGQPVLLTLDGAVGAHAVVAYGAQSTGTQTTVRFADPNFPTVGRTMTFTSGALTPIELSTKVGASGGTFTEAYALSVTSEVPLSKISSRFSEFTQQKAGLGRYPTQSRVEYFDILTDTWKTLSTTLRTSDPTLRLRHVCTDCTVKEVGSEPDVQSLKIWDAAGTKELGSGSSFDNVAGTTSYYARLEALSPSAPTERGFVDAIPFTVIHAPFTVRGSTTEVFLGDTETFTASAGTLATAGSTYTWSVDDGSTPVVTTVPTYTHTHTKVGTIDVNVRLKDAAGVLIARATTISSVNLRFTLSPNPAYVSPGRPMAFTVTATNGIPPTITGQLHYTWIFGGVDDEDDVFLRTTVPTATHTFATPGEHNVRVIVSMDVPSGSSVIIGSTDQPVHVVNTSLAPRDIRVPEDSQVVFLVRHQRTHPANAHYKWTFSEGGTSDVYRLQGDTTVAYTFSRPGAFKVLVEVTDTAGAVVGKDSTTATVDARLSAWKFTSMTVTSLVVDPKDGRLATQEICHICFVTDSLKIMRIASGAMEGGFIHLPRDTTLSGQYAPRGIVLLEGSNITRARLTTHFDWVFAGLSSIPPNPGRIIGTPWHYLRTPPRLPPTDPAYPEIYAETGDHQSGTITGTTYVTNPNSAHGWTPNLRQANVTFTGELATGTFTTIFKRYEAGPNNSGPVEFMRYQTTVTFIAQRVR